MEGFGAEEEEVLDSRASWVARLSLMFWLNPK